MCENEAITFFSRSKDRGSFSAQVSLSSFENYTVADPDDEDFIFYVKQSDTATQIQYDTNFGPKCTSCGSPCGSDVVYFHDLPYHRRHFTCFKCHNMLVQPVQIDNHLYCGSCANDINFCQICKAPKTKESKLINGITICASHFHCATCRKELKIPNFVQIGSSFYCPEHKPEENVYICKACNHEIQGKPIIFSSQRYHKGCLKCSLCKATVDHGKLLQWKSKPICQCCFNQLPKQFKANIMKMIVKNINK